MRIKRLKKFKINCYEFSVKWDKTHGGGSFSYNNREMEIGLKGDEGSLLMVLCHELMEICALEMNVRFTRPDVSDDYIFMYDHRQHETMMNMFAGALSQFLD